MTSALLAQKLENIHENLMQIYKETQNYPAPIQGAEREIVKNLLLAKILPPNYRVGCGAVIDADSQQTGQLDAIIEMPFSVSFPISGGDNRLYIADGVGIVFEVKSDLVSSQKTDANKKGGTWEQVIDEVSEVRRLSRFSTPKIADKNNETIIMENERRIPVFVIAYKSREKIETIQNWIGKSGIRNAPNGILLLESEIFFSPTGSEIVTIAKGKAASIFAFISSVLAELKRYEKHQMVFDRYTESLEKLNRA